MGFGFVIHQSITAETFVADATYQFSRLCLPQGWREDIIPVTESDTVLFYLLSIPAMRMLDEQAADESMYRHYLRVHDAQEDAAPSILTMGIAESGMADVLPRMRKRRDELATQQHALRTGYFYLPGQGFLGGSLVVSPDVHAWFKPRIMAFILASDDDDWYRRAMGVDTRKRA